MTAGSTAVNPKLGDGSRVCGHPTVTASTNWGDASPG